MNEAVTRARAVRAVRSAQPWRLAVFFATVLAITGCSASGGDACEIEDQDGIIGGMDVFVLRIHDDSFAPPTLKAQNLSDVTLTLENQASSEAGFMVDCLPTPNDDGCAQESCFPDAATIDPINPGESARVEFQLPQVEGKYIFRTLPEDDERTGEFIVD